MSLGMSQRKTLTVKFIANPPPPPAGLRHHYFWDDLVPGLGLRVSAKGHSSYVVYRRWPGTKGAPTRRSLGSTKHVPLAEARSRARDWLTQAANGRDPLAAVRAAKLAAARSQQANFAAVAEAWFAAE